MSNHYFIGIGGAGGNVLRELRKAEFFRKKEIDECEDRLKMRYLYVDSNELELNEASKQWQVLGNSVELPPADRLLIRKGDIAEAVRNVGLRPNISRWLGDPKLVTDMVGAAEGTPGAQQRRRFGRFLFAAHIVDFCAKVQSAVREMAEDGLATCMFHLIGTLAGGTGSGGLVDAALQIRRELPDAGNYKIVVYVLVTDDNDNGANVGYFYENQYAALKDINSVLVGKNALHDINSGKIFEGDDVLQQPIHKCVLVSNRNRHHITLSKEKQEKILADWLLQIAIAGTQHNLSQDFQHALTAEDIAVIHPAEPSVDNQQRSYRFGAVGILRWAAPQSLIRERLGYLVAQRIGSQLLYNHLSNRTGEFLEESNPANVEAFQGAHSLSDLGLTWQQLIQNEQDGASYEGEFVALGKNLKARYENAAEGALGGIRSELTTHYETGFQEVGVERYFANLASVLTERKGPNQKSKSDSLVHEIESTLRTAFLDEQLGLRDISQIVEDLVEKLNGEREQCRTLREKANTQIERLESSMAEGGIANWNKVGTLSRMFGKHKRLLRSYADRQVHLFIYRSQIEECRCAEEAIGALRAGLTGLGTAVQRTIDTLGRAQAKLRTEATTIERQLFEPQDLTKVEIDREELRNMEREMTRSSSHIAPAATAVRQSLFGEDSFFELAREVEATFFDHIVRDCDETVQKAHDDLIQDAAAGLSPVIGVNLLEVLYRKYGGTISSELNAEITQFMGVAVEALEIDNTAPTPSQVMGMNAPTMPKGMLLIQVPNRPAMGDAAGDDRMVAFEADIRKSLKGALQNAPKIEFAPSTDQTEITVVAVVSWMAARFASSVNGLKKKYRDTIEKSQDKLNAGYFCHLDDNYKTVQDLFPAETKDVRDEAETLMDLGLLCGVVMDSENEALLLVRNANGEDGPPMLDDLAKSRKDYLNGSDSELETGGRKILKELAAVPEEKWKSALAKESETLKEIAKDTKNLATAEYRARSSRLKRFKEIMEDL